MNEYMNDWVMKSETKLELHHSSTANPALESFIGESNLLRLVLLDASVRELTHPKLAREYIAGSLEDEQTLGIFHKSFVRSVEFLRQDDLKLKVISFSRKTVGEQLASQSFPARARFSYRHDLRGFQSAQALGVARGFLVTDFYLYPCVPLAALSAIELSCE